MSKGLGSVQLACLKVLRSRRIPVDSITIACIALGKDAVTEAEDGSHRRALRGLARAGLAVDLGRNFPDKRRRWASRTVAERHYEKVRREHGAKAAKEAMSRGHTKKSAKSRD